MEQVQVPDELADFATGNHKKHFYGYPAIIRIDPRDRQRKLSSRR
jgi:hypothetical protein